MLFKILLCLMFILRMVEDECSQPEQLPPLTFFLIFSNITTTDCSAVTQLVQLKGGTLVECWRRLLKKRWVQSHFQTGSGVCIWFLPHIYPTFTKSFFNYSSFNNNNRSI